MTRLYVGNLPFTANEDTVRAMQALNGKDFGGRPLKVNEAQDRARSGGGGGGYGRRR